jgi:hypothetical protein
MSDRDHSAFDDPVFGRGDMRAWEAYEIKGNLLAARPRYVRDRWGDGAVRDVADRLSDSLRPLFDRPVMPFS